MNSKLTLVRPEAQLQWLGTVNDGKQLELFAEIEGLMQPLITLVADDADESLWFEIRSGEHLVQVPVSQIQRMLEMARGEVHSEAWYEANVYKTSSDT
jgi:hypothetical protein